MNIDGRETNIEGRNTTFLMIRGKKDRCGMESRRDGGINFRMFIRLFMDVSGKQGWRDFGGES